MADMTISVFFDPTHVDHLSPETHPERPERLAACLDALRSEAVEATFTDAPEASDEQLLRVHDRDYLTTLKADCPSMLTLDTYVTPASFDIAKRAAGSVCAAIGTPGRSFALIRPPGHHAGFSSAMGFCLINSVAVGAAEAIASGSADRVAIVDLDVHHGNGTQQIFWERNDVLYLSMHQYPWYPWDSGSLGEVGEGDGEGATVNIPLPAMTGDDVYITAIGRLVLPILRAFAPDLILVSAGFDAHSDDPLSLQEVSADGFGIMMSVLAKAADELCAGRIVSVLEGGYDLDALAASFVTSVKALVGDGGPFDSAHLSEGMPFGAHGLSKVIDFHGRHWNL